jgi:CubicO group peptidase (beta-lactamase class C family)
MDDLPLFTHTSGLIYESSGGIVDQIYREANLENAGSLEELVARLAGLPLKWHPGTQFEYGFSTDVLGRVIEVVSGQRLDESFGWNGMATTYFWIDPAEGLVTLCFTQHLPHDEHGLFQRFRNLCYQALA